MWNNRQFEEKWLVVPSLLRFVLQDCSSCRHHYASFCPWDKACEHCCQCCWTWVVMPVIKHYSSRHTSWALREHEVATFNKRKRKPRRYFCFCFCCTEMMKTLRRGSDKEAVKCGPWTLAQGALIRVPLTPPWLDSIGLWFCARLVRKQLLTV